VLQYIPAFLAWYILLLIENRRQNGISLYQLGICQQKWLRISGAGTILGQGGQDQERQSLEREKGSSLKNKRSLKKKKVFVGSKCLFVPKTSVD